MNNARGFLFVLCSFLFLSLTSNDGNKSLSDGLVAHYDFNNCHPDDLTNGGSDGEIFGSPSCVCGVEGNGFFFDGINDYMEFPGPVNRCFNTTDFTISFYFKPGKYSVFPQSMISKRQWCQDTVMLDIQMEATHKKIKTDIYESSYKFFKNISPDLPKTDWVHFALVRSGQWAYTYVNGEFRREVRKCSGVDIGNDALLSFANSPCANGGRMVRFKGGLDELRVYNRALDEEEIAKLYALHPVENAEADCVTYLEENNGIEYICGVKAGY